VSVLKWRKISLEIVSLGLSFGGMDLKKLIDLKPLKVNISF
jgi:hypothetical protein